MKCYEVLDIPPGSDTATIRNAYIKLCRVWQPAREIGNPAFRSKAAEKYQEIVEAYASLSEFLPELKKTKDPHEVIARLPASGSALVISDDSGPLRRMISLLVALIVVLLLVIGLHLVNSERKRPAPPDMSAAQEETAAPKSE